MWQSKSNVWAPFWFSAVLCAIALIGNLVGRFFAGDPNAGMIAFLGFLPMAFLCGAYSHREALAHIAALEARVHELEQDASRA